MGDNASSFVWVIFIPWVIFLVTGISNGANLTDGLDGLATGVTGIIGATLAVLAYVSGNVIAADYLGIMFLPGSHELVIFSACLLGACIGFLWYNSYPAQIFMGDTGSLTLGWNHCCSGHITPERIVATDFGRRICDRKLCL